MLAVVVGLLTLFLVAGQPGVAVDILAVAGGLASSSSAEAGAKAVKAAA